MRSGGSQKGTMPPSLSSPFPPQRLSTEPSLGGSRGAASDGACSSPSFCRAAPSAQPLSAAPPALPLWAPSADATAAASAAARSSKKHLTKAASERIICGQAVVLQARGGKPEIKWPMHLQ